MILSAVRSVLLDLFYCAMCVCCLCVSVHNGARFNESVNDDFSVSVCECVCVCVCLCECVCVKYYKFKFNFKIRIEFLGRSMAE